MLGSEEVSGAGRYVDNANAGVMTAEGLSELVREKHGKDLSKIKEEEQRQNSQIIINGRLQAAASVFARCERDERLSQLECVVNIPVD